MNKSDLYHPYTNNNGKRVNGSAALMHYIGSVGGVQEYNDEIGAAYVMEFVREHSDIINDGLIRKARRQNFKVVS